jgi:Fe-S-cluster containining protein
VKTSAELGLTECNRCGGCCRNSTCHLSLGDVPKIAKHLGITGEEFARKYLAIFRPQESRFAVKPRMTESGCVFLRGNDCAIQDVKPKGGREYECWTPQPHASRYWWPSSSLSRIGVAVER